MPKSIYRERMEKLLAHMQRGKLFHDLFDFSVIHSDDADCGTVGCMLGELPFLWPQELYIRDGNIFWRRDGADERGEALTAPNELFGLDASETLHLFYPNRQIPYRYGGARLNNRATRFEVAQNLEAFLHQKRWEGEEDEQPTSH